VTDPIAAPRARGSFIPALAGGVIGSLVTAALLLFAAPQLLSSRIVREGMMADPQILPDTVDALRDAQYTPVLTANRAALETPFGSSWKGAVKPQVTLVEFFDYACPYCKASNPFVEQLIKEQKDLRFAQFHDALWAAGRPAPQTIAVAASAAGIPANPTSDAAVESELKRNFDLAGQLGATGTPLFIVGNRVLNGAVGYDALKEAITVARNNQKS